MANIGDLIYRMVMGSDVINEQRKLKMLEKEKEEERTIQSRLELPSITQEEERQKLEQLDEDPSDYEIKPIYSTLKGIKTITGYKSEPITKKSLGDEQLKALNATIGGLGQLNDMERLVKTGKVGTGPLTGQALPFGVRAIRAGFTGTNEDLAFSQYLRDFQNSYITAKTGAQRGFPEMMFLTIALPGGEMPPQRMLNSIQNARDVLNRNLYEMLSTAKKTKREISGFKDQLNILEEKFGQKNKEISDLDLEQQQNNFATFNIKGKIYRIPKDKIEEFKKDMGL